MADAERIITCVIKDANGNEVTTVVESIESYLARKATASDLYNAIMKFSISAYNYLHKDK